MLHKNLSILSLLSLILITVSTFAINNEIQKQMDKKRVANLIAKLNFTDIKIGQNRTDIFNQLAKAERDIEEHGNQTL